MLPRFIKKCTYLILPVHMYRIYLMGQSAGAHIAACVLLDQAKKESEEKEIISWSVSQIKTYFGISGGYCIFRSSF